MVQFLSFTSILFCLFVNLCLAKNFIGVSLNKHGHRELRISYRHVLVLETTAFWNTDDEMILRQVTDGKKFVQSVYQNGDLQDCEYSKSSESIIYLIDDFLKEKKRVLKFKNFDVFRVYDSKDLLKKHGAYRPVTSKIMLQKFRNFVDVNKQTELCHIMYTNNYKLSMLENNLSQNIHSTNSPLDIRPNYSKTLEKQQLPQTRPRGNRENKPLSRDNSFPVPADIPRKRSTSFERSKRDTNLQESATHDTTANAFLPKPYTTAEDISKSSNEFPKHDTTAVDISKSAASANEISEHETTAEDISKNAASVNEIPKPDIASQDVSKSVTGSSRRSKRGLFSGWLIFPGTKWCGTGDIAENFDDLGYDESTDMCCRKHDHCPHLIDRFTWKYNLFNYHFHTLSKCVCDNRFRKCLRRSKSPTAKMVGKIYFNVIGPQCFKLKREKTCRKRNWWGMCKKYKKSLYATLKTQKPF